MPSNLASARSITKAFNSAQIKTNDHTISVYLKYLCDTFAFYRVRRYDIQRMRYLASKDKYYLCDHSYKYAKLGTQNADYGRTIENIVAIGTSVKNQRCLSQNDSYPNKAGTLSL